jgi:hypothetical protein
MNHLILTGLYFLRPLLHPSPLLIPYHLITYHLMSYHLISHHFISYHLILNPLGMGVSSLVFSEDYGPVSPVDSQSSSSNAGYQKESSTKSDQSDRYEGNQHRYSPVQQQQQQQQQGVKRGETSSLREAVQGDEDSAIRRENGRLKLAIREVCSAPSQGLSDIRLIRLPL